MRFRLRTLLILMAVISLPLARVAYLKRMANTHRRIVADLIPVLAKTENWSADEVAAAVREIAEWNDTITVLEDPLGQPELVGDSVKDDAAMIFMQTQEEHK